MTAYERGRGFAASVLIAAPVVIAAPAEAQTVRDGFQKGVVRPGEVLDLMGRMP